MCTILTVIEPQMTDAAVLNPLIALMKDQVDALTGRGIDAGFINSSLSKQERQARLAALATVS